MLPRFGDADDREFTAARLLLIGLSSQLLSKVFNFECNSSTKLTMLDFYVVVERVSKQASERRKIEAKEKENSDKNEMHMMTISYFVVEKLCKQ